MNQDFLTPITAANAALAAWAVSRVRLPPPVRAKYISEEGQRGLNGAVGRVLEPHDKSYLASRPLSTLDLVGYLHYSRQEFLKLYLQQVRAAFQETSRAVRQFAAESDAPDLAMIAFRQSVRFHLLWTALRLSLVWRPVGPLWRLIEKRLGAPGRQEAPSDSGSIPVSQS